MKVNFDQDPKKGFRGIKFIGVISEKMLFGTESRGCIEKKDKSKKTRIYGLVSPPNDLAFFQFYLLVPCATRFRRPAVPLGLALISRRMILTRKL